MQKILIIRFSSIGDIVLTTPLVRCLKQQVPDAEIHYLTKEAFRGLLEVNPYVSKVFTIGKSVLDVIRPLRLEKYDFVVDLHKNIRSSLIIRHLMRPYVSFDKLNYEKWLLVKFKVNRLPHYHIIDRYFNAVKMMAVVNDGKGMDVFVPDSDFVNLNQFSDAFSQGYVGFVIGGKHQTKTLPGDKIVEVISRISKPVMLLGGVEDKALGDWVANQFDGRVVNTAGDYRLLQSASLVQQAEKIITHDTGLMHIAAAMCKPIVSVWGNTVPAFGMYPYYPKGVDIPSRIVQVAGLDCRPCSKLGFDECPKRHFNCMNKIDVDQIVSFIE